MLGGLALQDLSQPPPVDPEPEHRRHADPALF
jgi:hypothetical protein